LQEQAFTSFQDSALLGTGTADAKLCLVSTGS
jgi:hypothetical protein